MRTQFRILLLMLITSVISYGQRHNILKESIEVNKNTSIVLNLENIYVAIEESTDGKIHFDYSMEFDGYSKKDVKIVLNELTIKLLNIDSIIRLEAKSENKIDIESFKFKTDYGITFTGSLLGKKKDSIIQKTKDSLLTEMRLNNRFNWSKTPLKYINERFKKLDKNGKLSNIRKGSMAIMRSQFVIKIPPFIKVDINGKSCRLYFRNDLPNEMHIKLKSGELITKAVNNSFNKIILDDVNFEGESISGGSYEFKNVKNGIIGSTENVKIKSEFSKVEIGEIAQNTTITDFNSEYYFYNWSKDFERFNLYSEYSKIHMFYPNSNHSLKVIGNNTKNIFSDNGNTKLKINMQPKSKGVKYTMMKKEPYPGEKLSGRIFFDIVHGIIYSYNGSIKK